MVSRKAFDIIIKISKHISKNELNIESKTNSKNHF